MIDTTDTFFDTNKLYIKSVAHEHTLRGKRPSNTDSFKNEIVFGKVNKQMF